MKNRELFVRDPAFGTLINEGQARITEGGSKVLMEELSHFVCEGKYADGTIRILESFLKNLKAAQQPAAWVSGFYGSGKSHLLKMLHHLWVNTEFEDGSTARSLVPELPEDVGHALKELDNTGRRVGGLHAASGSLPSGASSPRLATLSIILRSRGLPQDYVQARFCLYLRENGFLDAVKAAVEAKGKEFDREINNLYISPVLREALLEVDPGLGSGDEVRHLLKSQFPQKDDITTTEFLRTAKEALASDGGIPATILLIDEIQQYISTDEQRATDVVELAEAISKEFNSRVILVGAGQSALGASTPQLVKLQARFTIPIELQDQDVETVTRKVLLRKKPDKIAELKARLERHAGEIDRQLANTKIGPRAADREILATDYPLLPTRRRFWEAVLRAVDPSGTSAMLRAQLRMIHDALHQLAEEPVGTVIPGDFIFDQLQPGMVQQSVLPRELDETIRSLKSDDDHGELRSRLCGLVFLIRQLTSGGVNDLGVRAVDDTLADLLVSDLNAGSSQLRQDLSRLLKDLVEKGVLLRDGDEYDLQTKTSLEWEKDFRAKESRLRNHPEEVHYERDTLLRDAANTIIGDIRLRQGQSNANRKLTIQFGDDPPQSDGKSIPIWVRDGWNVSEKSIIDAARHAGADSPTIFVFIPKVNSDDLQRAIIRQKAAKETLETRGMPPVDDTDAAQAYKSMEVKRDDAQRHRQQLVGEIVTRAKVYKGGGEELHDLALAEKVRSAAEDAQNRLFPRFRDGDHSKWHHVIERARTGHDKPLEIVDWNDETQNHPVCKEVLRAVGSGATGRDVHRKLEASPFGWPLDTINGALIALHATGHITARHGGAALERGQLDQNRASRAEFRTETFTLGAGDKMKLRGLIQEAGVAARPSDDLEAKTSEFLDTLEHLAEHAGGEPPLPERPKTTHLADIRALAGNERLAKLRDEADTLKADARQWKTSADLAEKRLPEWDQLQRLLSHGARLEAFGDIRSAADGIRDDRMLLDQTDHVKPLLKDATDALRAAVKSAHDDFKSRHAEELRSLEAQDAWQKLDESQRDQILREQGLADVPSISVGSREELLATLDTTPISAWKDKIDALQTRFANAAARAAKLLEPKVQRMHLTSGTLRSEEDVKKWLAEQEGSLIAKLKDGPIVIN